MYVARNELPSRRRKRGDGDFGEKRGSGGDRCRLRLGPARVRPNGGRLYFCILAAPKDPLVLSAGKTTARPMA